MKITLSKEEIESVNHIPTSSIIKKVTFLKELIEHFNGCTQGLKAEGKDDVAGAGEGMVANMQMEIKMHEVVLDYREKRRAEKRKEN